jgi:hypothetical protein
MNLEAVLLPHHIDQLINGSGIAPEVITARGYRSIEGPEGYSELTRLGFSRTQARNTLGLLIPIWTPDGRNGLVVYRPDHPRLNGKGRRIKYEIPKGASVHLDCPPPCRPQLEDPHIPLWVTEGSKKGDALVSRGLCAIDLIGVWNFKGKNDFGGTTFLADWDYIGLDDRAVYIAFDNDLMLKAQVRKALERLTAHLQRRGAQVSVVYLPPEEGKKIGVDDYLLTHTVQDLEGLVEQPRPEPQPAPPTITWLDDAPATLNKPLMLLDGRAYAMTWLWVESTVREKLSKDGTIVTLPEPDVTHVRRVFVVRDDGELFGEVPNPEAKPVRALGITLHAPDAPRGDLVWRRRSLAGYCRGARPDVKDIFLRIVAVYNHFLDFSRSLDEQLPMCRVSACLSLMTWLAEAFTVLPYPWANSPAPGSGKTKWGHCWTKTSRDTAPVGPSVLASAGAPPGAHLGARRSPARHSSRWH